MTAAQVYLHEVINQSCTDKVQKRTYITISLVLESQAIGTVSQTMLSKHQTSKHLKVDWTTLEGV